MAADLSTREFTLLQGYIKGHCGIEIPQEKAYLLKSRLDRVLVQGGLKSFAELHDKLRQGDKGLRAQVIDAITIKETLWFREKTLWRFLEDKLLPAYINELREGKRTKVRIWSAACATGEEPYSVAMCIDRYLQYQGIEDITLSHFEILATDISPTALNIAVRGRYDRISIARGLPESYKSSYLRVEDQVWVVDDRLKKAVTFQSFNLCDSFLLLGKFDIVLCRYVIIYFAEEVRKEVLNKMITVMEPEGVFFLGSSEMLADYMGELLLDRGGGCYILNKT